MSSVLPTLTVGPMLADAGTVALIWGPWLLAALAMFFGPGLLRIGVAMIKGGGGGGHKKGRRE